MDNKSKRITCTAMEKTNSGQFITVIKLIIPISVLHFTNELNQNAHSNPTGLAITIFQSSVQSQTLPCLSHYILKFSPTKPTTFSRLCKNSPVFNLLNSPRVLQSLSLTVSLQFILNQSALILSKQTLIS